jgi:hypothetical protein
MRNGSPGLSSIFPVKGVATLGNGILNLYSTQSPETTSVVGQRIMGHGVEKSKDVGPSLRPDWPAAHPPSPLPRPFKPVQPSSHSSNSRSIRDTQDLKSPLRACCSSTFQWLAMRLLQHSMPRSPRNLPAAMLGKHHGLLRTGRPPFFTATDTLSCMPFPRLATTNTLGNGFRPPLL